jgi:type IV pilus assembly protein PilW
MTSLTRQHRPFVLRRQQGVTLIELMVSMLISLIILGAVSVILMGSGAMRRTDDELSRIQENGRYALELMGRAIRQAGYRLDPDPAKPLGATLAAPNGVPFIEGTVSTLVVRHDPAHVPNAVNPYEGSELDCSGARVGSNNAVNTNTNLVVYTFTIVGTQLMCTPANGAATVIVDGVEAMQIEYGIDPLDNESITQYVTNPTPAQLPHIAAVRVNLRFVGTSLDAANRGQTVNFANVNTVYNDGFLRKAFTSTFTVMGR